MKVLSNKEIYVLLKILYNNSDSLEIDKTFTREELEHIQQELSSVNNKTVIEIENTQKPVFGVMVNSGYSIAIHDLNSVRYYAVKYVEAYIKGNLIGIASDIEFKNLLKDFYHSTKTQNNLANCKTKDLKYMPVVLFAYINNLVKLKSISHEKYDYTIDYPNDDVMFDNPFYFKVQANGGVHETKIDINMDTTELSQVIVTIGLGNQMEEINVTTLLEMLAKIKKERAYMQSEVFDENTLRDKLRKDFELTELAINILCACKYLMNNDTSLGNSSISEYLSQNNFPVSVNSIKQCTRDIKNKCVLPDTRGIPSLVQALELKGYIIPPLRPAAKV